jgi:hypothetical protein
MYWLVLGAKTGGTVYSRLWRYSIAMIGFVAVQE